MGVVHGSRSKVNAFDDIPVDIIEYICRFLKRSDFFNFALVSRAWAEALRSPLLWKYLCERDGMYSSGVAPELEITEQWKDMYRLHCAGYKFDPTYASRFARSTPNNQFSYSRDLRTAIHPSSAGYMTSCRFGPLRREGNVSFACLVTGQVDADLDIGVTTGNFDQSWLRDGEHIYAHVEQRGIHNGDVIVVTVAWKTKNDIDVFFYNWTQKCALPKVTGKSSNTALNPATDELYGVFCSRGSDTQMQLLDATAEMTVASMGSSK